MFKLSPRATLILLVLVLVFSMTAAFAMSGLTLPGSEASDKSTYVSDLPANATPVPGLSPVAWIAPTPTPTATPTDPEWIARSPAVSAREIYSITAKQALAWQSDSVLWEVSSLSKVDSSGRARGWRYRFYSTKLGASLELRSYNSGSKVITETLYWAGRNYVVPTMTFPIDMVIDTTQATSVANSAIAGKYGADWLKNPNLVVDMRAYRLPTTGQLTWDVSYTDGRRVVVVEVDAVKGVPLRLTSNQ